MTSSTNGPGDANQLSQSQPSQSQPQRSPEQQHSHQVSTPSSPAASQTTTIHSSFLKERRFKLSRACDRCRRRRIKCDEGHPCQACLTANSACTFEEPGKRSHPHKSKRSTTLEDRMQHLETLIQAIPPAVFAAGGSSFHNPALVPNGNGDASSSSSMAPFSYSPSYPSGVPPPSLHVFPLTNPSTHFTAPEKSDERQPSPTSSYSALLSAPLMTNHLSNSADHLAEEASRMTLAASYLYFDDEGYTRWQGETSGLPVLDLLLERHAPNSSSSTISNDQLYPGLSSFDHHARQNSASSSTEFSPLSVGNGAIPDWFPNRTTRRSTDVNPQTLWKLITSYIPPDLMDSLVQCYLSTSYYILPFLHVPTFLSDYGNPRKWGEPGFAAFIVSICCLASRHMDDPRCRADPNNGISAGTQWFELFHRLRTLPIADRPTCYNIQSNLIGAVYAVGLGRLSKASALLSEAITMCIDAGLHRSADGYDIFDCIEDQVRIRTFWCVYLWDKQLSAHFGRPVMIRLKDCDVGEPAQVDDEFITREAIGSPPSGTECRLSAFVVALRIIVVLESVLDVPPARSNFYYPRPSSPSPNMGSPSRDSSLPFLTRAATLLSSGGSTKSRKVRKNDMKTEENLLDEIHRQIPDFWKHSNEVLMSNDTIRLTQAERLHCAEHFVRLLIYRHRFSEWIAERAAANSTSTPGSTPPADEELDESESEALVAAHNSAVQLVTAHLNIAKKGMMTYYGVHVIHQLTQAGRTLVAVLLSCKTESLQHLIPTGLDCLRSCVGLLRRFSGRYVCGLRSGDLMEEFCRLTQIPLEPIPRPELPGQPPRPPWIRPVRKKIATSASTPRANHGAMDGISQQSSPEAFSPSDFFGEFSKSSFSGSSSSTGAPSAGSLLASPTVVSTIHSQLLHHASQSTGTSSHFASHQHPHANHHQQQRPHSLSRSQSHLNSAHLLAQHHTHTPLPFLQSHARQQQQQHPLPQSPATAFLSETLLVGGMELGGNDHTSGSATHPASPTSLFLNPEMLALFNGSLGGTGDLSDKNGGDNSNGAGLDGDGDVEIDFVGASVNGSS